MAHRSGFIGIIGRPNVGKSTILNYYLGEKIAIVSSKPQTTRRRILGVLTWPDAQLLFLDSPGLHQPEHALGRSMLESAKAVLEEADVLVVVIDGRAGVTQEDQRVFDRVKRTLQSPNPDGRAKTALLAINKVDIANKPKLLPTLKACAEQQIFADCIPVSAKKGDQMDVLLRQIIAQLPEGPTWYEPDQRTDVPLTERAGELIREQILSATHEEVPHAVAVMVDQLEETPTLIKIMATIFVEREGQKAILIGKQGSMMKRIGQAARQELERLVGRKVHVELWVKVADRWRDDERILRQLGLLTTD